MIKPHNSENPLIPVLSVEQTMQPSCLYALVHSALKLSIGIIVAMTAVYFNFYVLMFVSLIFIVSGIYKYLMILSCKFFLTGQQLIFERGLFSKTITYLELYRIKDILVNQSFWMRPARLINIYLLSIDSAVPLLSIKGIKSSAIVQVIRNHVQECRKMNKVLSIDGYDCDIKTF